MYVKRQLKKLPMDIFMHTADVAVMDTAMNMTMAADAVVAQVMMLVAAAGVLMTMGITTMTMITKLVTHLKRDVMATVAAAAAANVGSQA